ncbi:MAG: NAD(P)H-hydrate dehydratase [Candidatus Omnitrophica bacterium]|nr:NAD(P)H-hydrate dehydratase [Candidatus Omnitrophota bacterium]
MPAPLFNRKIDSHKGDYGHVLILAGSQRFVGAPVLSAASALKAGAGLVTLGVPHGLYPVIASKVAPEAMVLPLPQTRELSLSAAAFKEIKDFSSKTDCVLLGPGLSIKSGTRQLVCSLTDSLDVPLVIDADGLNCLTGRLDILKRAKMDVVLTPHPGEMADLCGYSVGDVQNKRKKVAKDFALRYNITLVLKGYETVVASSHGEVYVNHTGNPGMATAGSGDCLAGILAAFIGQGIPAYDAARLAVYVHGLAGDLAAKDKTQICLVASDIIEYLPKAFKSISK